MAKEPRFSRRALAEGMVAAINKFPEHIDGNVRNLTFMPSFYQNTAYIFLQIKHRNVTDYENEYRPMRAALLKLACGVAKNKFPHLTKVVGIAIDAPKFTEVNSEDFVLLNCDKWSSDDRKIFEEGNKELRFFETPALKKEIKHIRNFPRAEKTARHPKVGRNELCPCGSGKKFKRCHGAL